MKILSLSFSTFLIQNHWDKVTTNSYGYLEIKDGYRMVPLDVDYKERMEFWDSAMEIYGKS